MQADTHERRRVLVERLVIVAVVAAVLVELRRVGAGVSGAELAGSWQLLDRELLAGDLLRSVWYLHTQPPLHNVVVGLVLWSPLPAEGTLFVLYGTCLLVLALLVHHLLRRWRGPGAVACAVACLVVIDPGLLVTIYHAGYEVPVATMLVGLVALVDRQMAAPSQRLAVGIAALGTAIVLTRALFHPVWLAAVLLIVLLARPVGRRSVLVAVAVPVLAVGGVVAKNASLVSEASLSTWTGFNLQRGVLGPMSADDVAAAIDAGRVTSLAAQPPWRDLDAYAPWLDGCRPAHDHPALADPSKAVGGVAVPNFNHECFMPLYDESSSNARAMIRREPGSYLAGRVDALVLSFAVSNIGEDGAGPTFFGEMPPRPSWMDRVHTPLMLTQHRSIDMSGWNIPLFGDRLPVRLGWTLVLLAVVVAGRTVVAAVRTVQALASRRSWPGDEVVWLVGGGTVLFAIVGGDLVELGENGRFRSMLDPLLVLLATRAVVEAVIAVRARRSDQAAADDPSPAPAP